jgi:hypothetical protein
MRLRTLSIFAIFCWTPSAQAQDCADIYRAIRQETMYCGFFCYQRKIEPLQKVYEKKCIPRVAAASSFDLDDVPHDPMRLNSHQ